MLLFTDWNNLIFICLHHLALKSMFSYKYIGVVTRVFQGTVLENAVKIITLISMIDQRKWCNRS